MEKTHFFPRQVLEHCWCQPGSSRSIKHWQKIGVAIYSHFEKLPVKINFSNISLILSWWHWHSISQVPFQTCLSSVLYLKYEIGCSLARGEQDRPGSVFGVLTLCCTSQAFLSLARSGFSSCVLLGSFQT